MPKPVEFYRMKDSSADYRIQKGRMFDLPMRLLIVGKSMLSGKSNYFCNLLSRPFDSNDEEGKDMYRKDFKAENIFIFSPSCSLDDKIKTLRDEMEIPLGNVFDDFSEDRLESVYNFLERKFHYEKEEGLVPSPKLIILDDCSFGGGLKKKQNGTLAKVFMNGRHIAVSVIVTSQKYSDIPTSARENCTGCVLFECTRKQQELIYEDHGMCDKKKFIKAFNTVTEKPHNAFIVNYSNHKSERFMDHHYNVVDLKDE